MDLGFVEVERLLRVCDFGEELLSYGFWDQNSCPQAAI